MREYYGRFLRELWSEFHPFGKGQIIVGLIAAVIQIIREGQNGAISSSSVIPSVEAAVGSYLAICAVRLGWTVIRAPYELDRQRAAEISSKDSALAALQEGLSKKHPRDERREALVAEVWAKIGEGDRKFLEWLLHTGRSSNQAVAMGGFRDVAEAARSRTGSIHLVDVEIIYTDNGAVERDRFYQINPQLESALTAVLHSPRADAHI